LLNLFMTCPLNAALSRGVTYLKLNPRTLRCGRYT